MFWGRQLNCQERYISEVGKKNAILGILRLALKSTLPNSDFTLYQLFLSTNCIQIFPPSNQGIMYMKKKKRRRKKEKKSSCGNFDRLDLSLL